jgi:hypothetical protein
VRNWQTGNQLLINTYATATKIAYGDGIGYYFGPKRFQPAPQGFKALSARVKAWLSKLRSRTGTLPTVPFDCSYLLLPHIFKETPSMPFRIPDRRFLDSIVQRVAEALPAEYRLTIELQQAVVVLVSGNFAHVGWTTRKLEFNAYVETLLETTNPQTLIIVKPHPRLSPEDVCVLQQTLHKHFPNLYILEPPVSYIPLEVLLFNLRGREQSFVLFGFTTACIPLAFLYGITCNVGFGRSRLKRYFPGTHEHMWENETLLRSIVHEISTTQKNAHSPF